MNIPNVTYSSIKLIYTSDVEHTVDMSLSSTYRASFAGNARIEITYKSNISYNFCQEVFPLVTWLIKWGFLETNSLNSTLDIKPPNKLYVIKRKKDTF